MKTLPTHFLGMFVLKDLEDVGQPCLLQTLIHSPEQLLYICVVGPLLLH